jgi:hypothetical protein
LASGASEIVDLVDFDIEREGHVMPLDFEVRIVEQVRDIRFLPGEEIVDAQHVMPVIEQARAQMAADEAGAAGDQDLLLLDMFERHAG